MEWMQNSSNDTKFVPLNNIQRPIGAMPRLNSRCHRFTCHAKIEKDESKSLKTVITNATKINIPIQEEDSAEHVTPSSIGAFSIPTLKDCPYRKPSFDELLTKTQ
jgi:hypothetical protein